MFETYGQSETSGVAFSQRTYDDLGSTGFALEGVEARINDESELLLRGEGIFTGYLNDPEKTEAAFVDGDWYRSGDVARFDEEGRLVILDREKHVIRLDDGRELSPSEIENKLKLSPYVCDAMVIGGVGPGADRRSHPARVRDRRGLGPEPQPDVHDVPLAHRESGRCSSSSSPRSTSRTSCSTRRSRSASFRLSAAASSIPTTTR